MLLNYRVKMPFRIYPKAYTRAAFDKAKWLIKNILGFNLINYWARNADNLIIGKWYTNADLGIYSKAYSLLTLPLSMISVLFGTVLFPSLKKLKSEGGDIKKEYAGVLGIVSLMSWPVAFILIVFARPIVDILWGEKWFAASEFLPYFGILVLTQTIISTTGNFFILLNKERAMFWIGISVALFLVLCIAIGAFFSVLDVARFYVLGYLAVVVPIIIFFSFMRSFGYSWQFVFTFWGPKLLLSLLLLASIWKGEYFITIALMFAYLLHLLIEQRTKIATATAIVKRFLSR